MTDEEIAELNKLLQAEREQRYILESKLRVVSQDFDDLARAVGWSPERCQQDGDSPITVAITLMKDWVGLNEELKKRTEEAIRLRANNKVLENILKSNQV